MKNELFFKNIFSVMDNYDVFFFDIWGVITEGEKAYPEVAEAINKIIDTKKVFFITNAPRTTQIALERLNSLGINASFDNIITSGEVARDLIVNCLDKLNLKDPIIYHLGADRNEDILKDIKVETTNEIKNANILLLSVYRDQGEDLEEFDDLFNEVCKLNLITICTNPDTIIPHNNSNRYCTGYFAEKLEKKGQKIIYTGKPFKEIYDLALENLIHIPKNRILMIGDTFETDILGANTVGIHSALVLTGNAAKFHHNYTDINDKLINIAIAAEKANAWPNFVIELK